MVWMHWQLEKVVVAVCTYSDEIVIVWRNWQLEKVVVAVCKGRAIRKGS